MKTFTLIFLLILCIGCNNQKKHFQDLKSNTNSDSSNCNHNPDYSFCDNLDTAIFHAERIKQLIIYRKSYKSLPNEIIRLKNLKGLTIKNQQDINWVDAFAKLSQIDSLESIEIVNSPVKNLSNINKLKNLKELSIYDKHLFTFPPDLFLCNSLTDLKIICPIVDIPKHKEGLKNLVKLTITLSVKDYPMSLTNFSNLEYLDIGGNVELLPFEITNLKRLRNLYLYDTPIGKEELGYFKKHNKLNKLRMLKDKMINCNFVLESPLPPI